MALAGGSRPAGSDYLVFKELASWHDIAGHPGTLSTGKPDEFLSGDPREPKFKKLYYDHLGKPSWGINLRNALQV